MIQALNLIQDRLHLERVVLHRAHHAQRVVVAADVRDLRRVQIVHTLAGAAVHEVIGGVLVRPRGSAGVFFLDDVEHRVGADRIVRIERRAMSLRIDVMLQGIRIDHVLRNSVHVNVDRLVENHLRARRPGAGRVVRRPDRAVVAVIVEKPVSARRTSGYERQQPRKRVRVCRSPCIGERGSMLSQFFQRRSWIGLHIVGDVQRMHPVDADQEHVFYISAGQPVACLRWSGIDRRGQSQRDRDCQ